MPSRLFGYFYGCKPFVTHLVRLFIHKKGISLRRTRQPRQVIFLAMPGAVRRLDCRIKERAFEFDYACFWQEILVIPSVNPIVYLTTL